MQRLQRMVALALALALDRPATLLMRSPWHRRMRPDVQPLDLWAVPVLQLEPAAPSCVRELARQDGGRVSA